MSNSMRSGRARRAASVPRGLDVVLAIMVTAAVAAGGGGRAFAAGEVHGRMGGTVTEAETGAPVPGATVTVSSSGLIGGPRTVVTGERGTYQIADLPPGAYSVEVGYANMKPTHRTVIVRQGELTPLDVKWSAEVAGTDVTYVVEERHLTKPDSTQSGTVITAEQSSRVATNREYQDIAEQVAGIVDVNGGGNPQVKGMNLLGNKYLVDGLEITDPVTQTFSANINFDSISSVDIITGGMEAQYNATGGIINLITEGGSDTWRVDSSIYVNHSKLAASGQYGPNVWDGRTPASNVPSPPTQQYQINENVGGPLIKNKLWFHESVEFDYTEFSTPAGPPLNLQAPTRRFTGLLARFKLTWAPSAKHRLTLSTSADPSVIDNNARRTANARLPIAQIGQEQGGFFSILQWSYFATPNVTTTVQAGFAQTHVNTGPQGILRSIDPLPAGAMFSDLNKTYDPARPGHNNLDDGSYWYQGDYYTAYDDRYRFQLDPSVSVRGDFLGTHDAKAGLQTSYKYSTYHFVPSGGGAYYFDADGGPLEDGLCNESMGTGGCFQKQVSEEYTQRYSAYTTGLFLQDRWRLNKRLAFAPGVRFDYGRSKNSQGETASSLFAIGPRFGVLVDPVGDKKTTIYAFYGRVNEVDSLLAAAYTSSTPYTTTYGWDADAKVFNQVVDRTGGPGGYKVDPSSKTAPHTDEISAGVRRELGFNTLGSIEYTYKRMANLWDLIETNVVWDPTGFRQLTDAKGNPVYRDAMNPQKVYLATTNHGYVRKYQGIDFVVESRPSPRWDLYFAYTAAWLYGSAADQFGGQVNDTSGPGYNPRQQFLWHGFLPEDIRHTLKVRPSYSAGGLTLGGFMQFQTGAPYSRDVFQYSPDGAYVNRRTPIGTEANPKRLNDPTAFSELRVPDTLTIDVRAAYDLNAIWGGRHHVQIIADIFNVLNLRTPLTLLTADRDGYGQVATRLQPFRAQLALRYQF